MDKEISISQLRESLEKLEPVYAIISEIDPGIISVFTHSRLIADAISHYSAMNSRFLPTFILCDVNEKLPENISKIAYKYKAEILPLSHLQEQSSKYFCIYGNIFGSPPIAHYINYINSGKYYMDKSLGEYLSKWWQRKPCADHIERRIEEILFIYNKLNDQSSKNLFLRTIKMLQTGDATYLPLSNFHHYFHPKVPVLPGDIIIEGGIAGGGTTIQLAEQVGERGKIIGFEPLPKYYGNISKLALKYDNILIVPKGLWSCKKNFYIEDKEGSSKLQMEKSPDSILCSVTDLDSCLFTENLSCNMIKLDIEGAEFECLKGAFKIMQRFHPKLAISIYHHAAHYIDIPIWLMKNFPEYRFYMGHHSTWYHETCLYAIRG